MSSISGIGNSAAANYLAPQAAAAKAPIKIANPSGGAVKPTANSGTDADGDHDGDRFDASA